MTSPPPAAVAKLALEDGTVFTGRPFGSPGATEGEVVSVEDGNIQLKNGREAHVTLHVMEGSKEEIERQLKQSIEAFFEIYPEI